MKTDFTRKNKVSGLSSRIMKSVRARGRGAVFTWKDFAVFGKPDAIRQTLARLVRRGMLRRVARGIYDWPSTVASLGITVAPDVLAVVQAVARRDGARIQPDGARAANQLGLSTQVPARDSFRSTGHAHRIAVGNRVIDVRTGSARLMAAAGGGAGALVIAALGYLGRRDIDADDIARLQRILAPDDKAALRRAAPVTYRWMRPILLKIAA